MQCRNITHSNFPHYFPLFFLKVKHILANTNNITTKIRQNVPAVTLFYFNFFLKCDLEANITGALIHSFL